MWTEGNFSPFSSLSHPLVFTCTSLRCQPLCTCTLKDPMCVLHRPNDTHNGTAQKSIYTRPGFFFFPAAGRLVFVSDWEPREEEGETEEKRRFLAVSPLSSIALWLSWSSPVWSTSTVRSSSSNDKQLRLWSQSQKIAFSSFTFSSLLAVVWNLFNRSWTFPNMTQKNLELILLKNRPDYIIGENQWIN